MNNLLLELPAEKIIGFIADAAWRWCNPDFPPRVRLTQELVARTGYSVPVVEYALDCLMSGLTRTALRSAIEDELGSLAALDTFIEREGRPRMHARPRGRVTIISSRTTIGVALPAAMFALATKNSVTVKDREDGLVRAFFETLAQEHPAFAQAAVAYQWSGEEPGKLAGADVVVAFGNDDTLQRIRAGLPARTEFVGFGSRISCGFLDLAVTKPSSLILGQAARDIVLYDSEGCMSLHVLFVAVNEADAATQLPLLAENLAQKVATATHEFPPGAQDQVAKLAAAAARARLEFQIAIGTTMAKQIDIATVIVERDAPPPLRPFTTLIVPVRDETEVAPYLQRHDLRIETLAVAYVDSNSAALAKMIGAHRVTTFGSMQDPDLAGDHGGRPRTLDFVQLIDLETAPLAPPPTAPAATTSEPGDLLEALVTEVPGPRSLECAVSLATYEAQGVTYLAEDFPIFWERAEGANVIDVDGNRYIDCTAAFGVAAVGHGNPRVVAAITQQAQRLLHSMGDVHPSAVRASYLERLSAIAPGNLDRCFLASNGADAVEFALKTAMLKTRRPAVLYFEGGYHGLSLGTLEVAGIDRFRSPFLPQLRDHNVRLPYPTEAIGSAVALAQIDAVIQSNPRIGAILIEPIAGRAGTLLPGIGVLAGLREIADRYDIVLIFDEIYTGFGRTGSWFACETENAIPDILCVGKAIAGGFPLSAAIGNEATFSAWPRSEGEAIHTATYLGNPMACAAGHAVLDELEAHNLVERAAELGDWLSMRLAKLAHRLGNATDLSPEIRGRGLMWAFDLGNATIATRATIHALHAGLIVLPQGIEPTAIALTPPLTISKEQLTRAIALLENAIIAAWNETQAQRIPVAPEQPRSLELDANEEHLLDLGDVYDNFD